MKSKVLLGLVGICCLAIGILGFSLLRMPESDGEESLDASADKFSRIDKWKARGWESHSVRNTIQRREVSDPRNFAVEWSLGGVSQEIRDAAKNADKIGNNLDRETEWADYYNILADSFFLNDILEICGPQYTGNDDCYVSLKLVSEPHQTELGTRSVVSYTAVSAVNPPEVECRKYASCIARGFIGRELPAIPGGGPKPQGTIVTWGLQPWDDDRIQVNSDKILGCIAKATEDLRVLREDGLPPEDMYLMEYMVGKFEDRLSYCEWLREELD